MVLPNDIDLFNPPGELGTNKHKLKFLIQRTTCFVEKKCQGCYNVTIVHDRHQSVVLCGHCQDVVGRPTGGRIKPTEGHCVRAKKES
ncbi:small ribosomal subunit protein eS27z-like [Lycium ferocissimum]|uniref:small ribosomal subunit protein eS27z-like n=1 Tax=Lycium ferocissimum TaxID=112874 RepID=UPI00281584AC|nr:small ribosomal subunit protein eS27z-like [Lycium ferocissimum]